MRDAEARGQISSLREEVDALPGKVEEAVARLLDSRLGPLSERLDQMDARIEAMDRDYALTAADRATMLRQVQSLSQQMTGVRTAIQNIGSIGQMLAEAVVEPSA